LRVCVMAAPPHPANKAVSAFVPHSATALHTWATPGLKPARRARGALPPQGAAEYVRREHG